MSGTHKVVVGNEGRLVVPADVCARAVLEEGTILVLLETDDGLVLMSQAQLQRRVRDGLKGATLVQDLIAERREAARDEDRDDV